MSKFHKTAELPRAKELFRPEGYSPLLDQLEQLQIQTRALEVSVSALERGSGVLGLSFTLPGQDQKEVLRMMVRARADRRKFLPPELFADPAWDMLLDLYLADIMSMRVSVSSLCSASNVPATTALRWIGHLTNEGLIERMSDPCDGRRDFIVLSKAGLAQMDGYFEALARRVTRRAH